MLSALFSAFMSSTTGTARTKGLKKRLTAMETIEIVNVTVDTTLTELHVNAVLNVNNAAGKTVTFPQDSDNTKILIGHSGLIKQGGAGAVTLSAGTGATVNLAGITPLGAANRYARWIKIAANTYDVFAAAVS